MSLTCGVCSFCNHSDHSPVPPFDLDPSFRFTAPTVEPQRWYYHHDDLSVWPWMSELDF